MNETCVSIIVLTYNHVSFIKKALDSIFMQKVEFSYEVLICDDFSTDGTQKILEAYEERYPQAIRVVYRKENLGATRNLYDLLFLAKGKYLAMLDGDDYWTDENKLNIQVSFLENNYEYIGCAHHFTIVNEEGYSIKGKKLGWIKKKKVFSLKDFKGLYLPSQFSTFVYRNIFINPSHDYSILFKAHKLIGDRTLNYIYLLQGDIFTIDKTMGSYRFVRNRLSTNATSLCYIDNNSEIQQEIKLLIKYETYSVREFGEHCDFQQRKREICVDILVQQLKKPNSSIYFKYLFMNTNQIANVLCLPYNLIKKVTNKLLA